jgi:lambda repressor-like predicted transcriptional regulator
MLKARTIKIRLLEKGISQVDIGRSVGVVRSYVSHVIAGRSKNRIVREAIAQAICMNVADIWPEEKNNKRAA